MTIRARVPAVEDLGNPSAQIVRRRVRVATGHHDCRVPQQLLDVAEGYTALAEQRRECVAKPMPADTRDSRAITVALQHITRVFRTRHAAVEFREHQLAAPVERPEFGAGPPREWDCSNSASLRGADQPASRPADDTCTRRFRVKAEIRPPECGGLTETDASIQVGWPRLGARPLRA